jgi:hypothetical protein
MVDGNEVTGGGVIDTRLLVEYVWSSAILLLGATEAELDESLGTKVRLKRDVAQVLDWFAGDSQPGALFVTKSAHIADEGMCMKR